MKGKNLLTLKVEFTGLECRSVGQRSYVQLKLGSDDAEALRKLQDEVITHFEEFQDTDTTGPYDLHCSLLYFDTRLSFEARGRIVDNYAEEVENLGANLEPFILSRGTNILHEFPQSVTSGVPEWVHESLCLINFPRCSDEKSLELIRSIARVIKFDLDDHMIRKCGWDSEYYKKNRMVARFSSIKVRDDFHRHFTKHLSRVRNGFSAANINPKYSAHIKVGVFKALSREKDNLHFYAERRCCEELPDYRSKVDQSTSDHYLRQVEKPHTKHYFETKSDLKDLINQLQEEG